MSNAAEFNQLKANLAKAVSRVGEILHETKNPVAPASTQHKYDDKFFLAEYLTKTATAAQQSMLAEMGIGNGMWSQIHGWAKTQNVTLRFKSQSKCEFIETKTEKVEGNTEHVTEIKTGILPTTKITEKVYHKVTTHYWKYTATWQLIVFPGTTDPDSGNILKSETCDTVLTTSVKTTPYPAVKMSNNIDFSLNWLFETTTETGVSTFEIDRLVKTCKTPRRNTEIQRALNFFMGYRGFLNNVESYFTVQLFPVMKNHGLDLSWKNSFNVFVPVMPIFQQAEGEDGKAAEQKVGSAFILSTEQVNALLKQQDAEFSSKVDAIIQTLPTTEGLIRVAGAKMVMACKHAALLCHRFVGSIEYIEDMLLQQLISAIGKLVTPVDFQKYMEYHARKLLKPAYHPHPYSYAVRRPKHYPEGTLSIESDPSDGSMAQPVNTQVYVNSDNQAAMHFDISASTRISFSGEQYLHCWMTHQFRDSGAIKYNLTARARQYSCFVLMVGRISAANEFDPKHAIVLQNKDELIIPLLFEHLPSAGEFRDAIESLSPEQQRFAKAYRSMQLESTLFGLCIVQIKPQLERLLNLPAQSLTKERRLTQELMTLFTKYQISSDLVKYDGADDEKVSYKIDAVKLQVKTILTEIDEELNKELQEKKREAQFNVMDRVSETASFGGPPIPIQQQRSSSRGGMMRRSQKSAGPPMPMMAFASAAPPPSFSSAIPSTPVPAPQPKAAPVQPSEAKQAEPEPQQEGGQAVDDNALVTGLNYTALPAAMDARFLAVDKENALRSSILNLGKTWTKKFQKSVLAKPESTTLRKDEQKDEKNKAFDLLDALSRSGELMIENTDLHVILPVTHSFHDTLINTVIRGNVNPIESVERSLLLVTSMINDGAPMLDLAQTSHQERLQDLAPKFYITDES